MDAAQLARLITEFSYLAVFGLLLASGIGAPVSEELILVLGGIAVAKGGGSLPLMMACAVVGTMIGDFTLYSIGRKLGAKATTSPKFRKILTPARVAKVEGYFQKYGGFTIFASGFVAGVRAPTFLIAGIIRFPRAKFVLWDFFCVAIFAPGITYLGYRFGLGVIDRIKGATNYVIIGVIVLVFLLLLRTAYRWMKTRSTRNALKGVVTDEPAAPPTVDTEP